ncbi:MAG: M23 family metallopeptidase [Bacteroidales bacterium]|jgi:murein DD-endopeptidase MepM/ murein hydrolase activator NlpD|nr:M23 family metallopeptidase [Bacteroidales bacterium]
MSKTKKLIKWLKFRFRIVVMSRQTFEEHRKWNFSRFGFISLLLVGTIIIIAITSSVIAFTNVREFIPGYPDKSTKKAIIENAVRLDSLEQEILIRDQYLTNLKQVLLGEKPFNPELEISSQIPDTTNKHIQLTEDENVNLVEPLSKITQNHEKTSGTTLSSMMFPPVKGVVTNSFDPARGHYGTDIVTAGDEIVRASLDGTIIIANWTIETGYTIQIQHKENYITVYRHLKKLLHKTGDRITAGESIGVYGNTGEISFGPHLHFEIWHNGVAIDPEKHITF